eukprot:Em0005g86a
MAAEFKVPGIPERFKRGDGHSITKDTESRDAVATTSTPEANEIANSETSTQQCSDLSKLAPPENHGPQEIDDAPLSEPATAVPKSELHEPSEPTEKKRTRQTPLPSHETSEAPELSYIEPRWSGKPTSPHSLTVIKNGAVVDEIDLSEKPYHVFGRLPTCDIAMDHPSISRFHTILQCRPVSSDKGGKDDNHTLFSTEPWEAGFYVYDLGSTHGTFLNKTRIQPRSYYRVRVGQMVRLGGSSRLYVLEQDCVQSQEYIEEQAEEERREIVRQKEAYQRHLEEAKAEKERREKEEEEMGVSWGMMMDDVPPEARGEGSDEEITLDPEREAYYKDDPKKALNKFFEREGLELEYETEETGTEHSRTFTCRVRLPIDTATGEPVYAEATTGKKKEAVLQCALNACRLLESQGMLRRQPQGHKRKVKTWEENDYYDSDEDNFLDRTGEVEKKRRQRMRRVGKAEDVVENYQSLMTKLSDVQNQIATLEDKLEKAKAADSAPLAGDTLDTYMTHVDHHLDSTKQAEFKHQVHELKKEEERLKKLACIAKPATIPSSLLPHPTPAPPKVATSISKDAPPLVEDRTEGAPPILDSTSAPSSRYGLTRKIPSSHQTASSPASHHTAGKDTGSARNSSRPHRVLGPAPQASPALNEPIEEQDEDDDGGGGSKKPKPQWEEEGPDYSSWLPPDDQHGDGKTRLNEKFGY